MAGLIQGFLGGVGTGMAEAGKMMLASNLQEERAEANALRDRALRMDLQEQRQGFLSDDRDKTILAESDRAEQKEYSDSQAATTKYGRDIEAQKARDDAAFERTKYTADNKAAKNPQLIEYPDDKGNIHTGVLGVNADGTPNITPASINGARSAETITATTAAIKQANEEYSKEANAMESDKSQFGMTEKKWKAKRAMEITMENRSKVNTGSGLVNTAPALTPSTANPDATSKPNTAYDEMLSIGKFSGAAADVENIGSDVKESKKSASAAADNSNFKVNTLSKHDGFFSKLGVGNKSNAKTIKLDGGSPEIIDRINESDSSLTEKELVRALGSDLSSTNKTAIRKYLRKIRAANVSAGIENRK